MAATETQAQTTTNGSSSSWGAFLKSIASFNGDLSSLTAPPFILSGTSLTEFSANWAGHPSVLAAPSKEPDAEKRALLVLKWFLTTLKLQYASRSDKYGNEKKPLNPFLGELFLGKWEDDAGTTELISEQVSHHPPATAYNITNVQSGVRLEGFNAQKASFSGTIHVKQIGHALLTVPAPGSEDADVYIITLPSLHLEGLFLGSPFVELEGTSYISSSTGFTAKIDYSGKGWLSGKKNSVTATLYQTGQEKFALYNVTGRWTKGFEMHSGPIKNNSSKNLVETWDPEAHPPSELQVAPLEEQHVLESRRAWSKVADAILRLDMDTVSKEKGKIENAQRTLRAREKAEGRSWDRRYFSAHEGTDPILTDLASNVGLPEHGDAERTGGLWRYDAAKADKARNAPPLSAKEAAKAANEMLGQ